MILKLSGNLTVHIEITKEVQHTCESQRLSMPCCSTELTSSVCIRIPSFTSSSAGWCFGERDLAVSARQISPWIRSANFASAPCDPLEHFSSSRSSEENNLTRRTGPSMAPRQGSQRNLALPPCSLVLSLPAPPRLNGVAFCLWKFDISPSFRYEGHGSRQSIALGY